MVHILTEGHDLKSELARVLNRERRSKYEPISVNILIINPYLRYTVETTYNRPGYNREPVITGIVQIPVFSPSLSL